MELPDKCGRCDMIDKDGMCSDHHSTKQCWATKDFFDTEEKPIEEKPIKKNDKQKTQSFSIDDIKFP